MPGACLLGRASVPVPEPPDGMAVPEGRRCPVAQQNRGISPASQIKICRMSQSSASGHPRANYPVAALLIAASFQSWLDVNQACFESLQTFKLKQHTNSIDSVVSPSAERGPGVARRGRALAYSVRSTEAHCVFGSASCVQVAWNRTVGWCQPAGAGYTTWI